MSQSNSQTAKAWMILTMLTAWAGSLLQLYILVDNTPGNGMTPLQAVDRFLIFFTVWSNLVVAISLTCILLAPRSGPGRFFSSPSTQAAITLYIFVVGLIFNIILRHLTDLSGRDAVANELLHVIAPILFVLYWLIFVPKGSLRWKNILGWLIFPAVYLIYVMIRGDSSDFYPYPFLNLIEHGTSGVALNAAGIMLVFLVAGLGIIGIDKVLGPKPGEGN